MAAQAQRERDAAPRSGALRRQHKRPLQRAYAIASEAAPLDMPAMSVDEMSPSPGESDLAFDFSIAASVAEGCVPDRALRFCAPRRSAVDAAWATSGLSLAIHAVVIALALYVFQTPDQYAPGGDEAIPVEVVVAGSVDSVASNEGAHAAQPTVDVPLPPDIKPVAIAAAPVDVPIPPETPAAVVESPPLVIEPPPETTALAELTIPPVAALKPPEQKPSEPANSVAEPPKPVKVAKPIEQKRIEQKPRLGKPKPPEPRKVVASHPTEKQTPRRIAPVEQRRQTPQTAAAGRGAAGAGDSDATRQSSTRGSPGAAGSGGGAAAVASYRAQVMAHLARFKVYPEQARERGVIGRAVVAFTLTRTGQVTSASLAGSSGATMLDQATLAMVRRAAPFPAAPANAPAVASFSAAINYNLR